MSHIVSIKTEIRDSVALSAACRRLNLVEPVHETVEMFSAQATGHTVRLPGWRYPVVCDLQSGEIEFDNFGERWGRKQELESLIQNYAIEKAKLEARRAGHTVVERLLEDGSVKLTINVAETV